MAKLPGIALLSVALLSTAVLATEPAWNVGKNHPHLSQAQQAIRKAFNQLEQAQKSNEFDLGGHAAKARDLLNQADQEITQAAQSSNADKKQGQ